VPGQEEILDHVEDQQRLHPVVGESFPCLGEGEIPEPARMPEKIGHVIFHAERRGVFGFSNGGHAEARLAIMIPPCKWRRR
jgi:hypothetical protein